VLLLVKALGAASSDDPKSLKKRRWRKPKGKSFKRRMQA